MSFKTVSKYFSSFLIHQSFACFKENKIKINSYTITTKLWLLQGKQHENFNSKFPLRQCCGTVTIYYGSGSDFWKVMVPVPVPVTTLEKLWFRFRFLILKKLRFRFRFRFQLHIKTIKSLFKKKIGNFFDFLFSKLSYKEKVHEFQQIYGKMWMKKMFNEGNQIHNFMSSSGSGTVINYGSGSGSDFLTSYGSGYGSGSTSQKVTVPTVPVPVPQHCSLRSQYISLQTLIMGWLSTELKR